MLEGEVSHVEIPRTSPSLGITIVGGADTPLVSSALPIYIYASRVSIHNTILTKIFVWSNFENYQNLKVALTQSMPSLMRVHMYDVVFHGSVLLNKVPRYSLLWRNGEGHRDT